MRQTLIVNNQIYVQDENGLWRLWTITLAPGGAWADFGEPQTLEQVLGQGAGVFLNELSITLSGLADRACVQADDSLSADELTVTDVKGAILLKRLQEGEGEDGEAP